MRAYIQGPCFNSPDPICEEPVEERIKCYGDRGVRFCGREAKSVVPVETGCADGEGGITDCETRVGESVGLDKAEGVQVGGNYVVGGVFEICEEGMLAGDEADGMCCGISG